MTMAPFPIRSALPLPPLTRAVQCCATGEKEEGEEEEQEEE
jgi:hypothetical protein